MKPRTKTIAVSVCLALLSLLFIAGCATPRLEPGGAYAPVATNGVPTPAPDLPMCLVDMNYQVAWTGFVGLSDFEKANRALLWKVSPEIKHQLDKAREEAWIINVQFHAVRSAYLQKPTESGLSALQTILGKLEQLTFAAQAIVPTETSKQPTK